MNLPDEQKDDADAQAVKKKGEAQVPLFVEARRREEEGKRGEGERIPFRTIQY